MSFNYLIVLRNLKTMETKTEQRAAPSKIGTIVDRWDGLFKVIGCTDCGRHGGFKG